MFAGVFFSLLYQHVSSVGVRTCSRVTGASCDTYGDTRIHNLGSSRQHQLAALIVVGRRRMRALQLRTRSGQGEDTQGLRSVTPRQGSCHYIPIGGRGTSWLMPRGSSA